jgi:hypothetical protein
MKRSTLLRLAPALAIGFVLSCTTPTGVCGCPPSRTHAVAHGVVRTAAGAPVQGAVIRVSIFREQCGQGFAEPGSQPFEPAKTDAAGAYEIDFYSMNGPSTACVRVSATRGQGASADSVVSEGAFVQLRREGDKPARVRVDMVFPGS